jgi:serine/threonine-protein kinase RsbW
MGTGDANAEGPQRRRGDDAARGRRVPRRRPQRGPTGAASGARYSSLPRTGDGGVVRVTIPSNFAASHDLQKQIIETVQRCGFTSHSMFAIKLAMEEAMINAIKHGNKLDPSKHVHVAYRISPTQAEITIEDEGPGFDRHGVPDPTADENVHKCNGRGILLMEAYMNAVEFSDGGRRVRMVKRNEPELPAEV